MVNFRRYLTLTVLLAVSYTAIIAKQLTADEALARMNTISSRHLRARINSRTGMHLEHTVSRDGVNLFYLFNNDNDSSTVILGADDLLPAVLAYGITPFDMENIPGNVRQWMTYYQEAASTSIHRRIPLSASHAQGRIVEPLIRTKWNQNDPYNTICSEKVGQQVPTGCVATSMAQVMNYWQYPVSGKSSNSYNLNDKCELSADFRSTTYDWANMRDAYGNYTPEGASRTIYAEYTPEQAEAVATLMYHCGVACEMNYTKESSGSSDYKQYIALNKYFNYDKGMRLVQRSWFTDAEWDELLLNELYEHRPVLYSALTVLNEGHSFVCDGFDGNGYYHFNWGWAGMADGYYLIVGSDPLHPYNQGIGGSALSKPFTEGQTAIIGIQPSLPNSVQQYDMVAEAVTESSQGIRSLKISDSDDVEVEGNLQRGKIYQLSGHFLNLSSNNLKAEFGAIMRNTETGTEYVCGFGDVKELKPLWSLLYYDIKLDAVGENGTYEVYPAYRLRNDNLLQESWKKMKYDISVSPYIITIDGETPAFQIQDARLTSYNGYITDSPELSVTVKALRDISGIKLSANVSNSNNENINAFTISTSLDMNAGEVRTFDNISLRNNKRDKKLEPGKYYTVKISSTNYPYVLGNMQYTILTCRVDNSITDAIAAPMSNGQCPMSGSPVYDLSGRKVNSQLKKGLYIVNGKKVLLR